MKLARAESIQSSQLSLMFFSTKNCEINPHVVFDGGFDSSIDVRGHSD